jgi:hypothetical protein
VHVEAKAIARAVGGPAMVDSREGTTMARIDTIGASGEAERADPSGETVINGAPYDGDQTIRSGAQNPAAPVDRPDAQFAEEIKRRQVSLTVRYVAALRAR